MKSSFAQQWLEIVCTLTPEASSALFMMPDRREKKMRASAKWPSDLGQINDFIPIIKYVLKKQDKVGIHNIQVKDRQPYDFFGLPVFIQSELIGVIVIKTRHLPSSAHQSVFNNLQQAGQWLKLAHANKHQDDSFYGKIVGLLATCFEQESYHQGLIQLVTELTQQFNCERVAFAEFKHHHNQVVALSNSANFDPRSNLIKKIADVMDEAVEQDSTIIIPDPTTKVIQRAHKELARKFGFGSLCSIPLVHDQKIFGTITLLRSEETPFDQKTLDSCQQTLALITPFLALKRDNEKSLMSKIVSTLKQQLAVLFGFKYLKLKLIITFITLLLILTSQIESEFRVTADAILEGKIQRVVAAPVSGYLLSASVRAGDTVHKGDLMATLDDAELKLELAKITGQLQQARREYREALSTKNLVKVRIINAQMAQAKSEKELIQKQLDKIRLIAPFDGVVIEGDLSQMLGSPVERGDTLFKIAPLEGYRIILKVNERLISYIKPGQTGTLALSSMPDSHFQLIVEKITAVSNAENGANIFRVEASLKNPPELLRPGMAGIGKIDSGHARLLWIWTHEMTDWLRLWIWSWWP